MLTAIESYVEGCYLAGTMADLTDFAATHASLPILSNSFIRALLEGTLQSKESRSGKRSLYVKGALIDELLCLSDSGTESQPLPPIVFAESTFRYGLDVSGAFLTRLALSSCVIGPYGLRVSSSNCLPSTEPEARSTEPRYSLLARGLTCASSVCIESLQTNRTAHIDLSQAVIGGDLTLHNVRALSFPSDEHSHCIFPSQAEVDNTDCSRYTNGIGGIDISSAHIAGDLILAGVRVSSSFSPAVQADRVTVKGDLHFRCDTFSTPCIIVGGVNLMAADVGGQLFMAGVVLTSVLSISPADSSVAFIAENAMFGADVLWRADPQHPTRTCEVTGQIDMIAARIKGDFQFHGSVAAGARFRAINAKQAEISGDVRLGWLGSHLNDSCHLSGEVDFSHAHIGGKFSIRGDASIHLSHCPQPLELGRRRAKKYAVRLTGATILGDLLIEGSQTHKCTVQGIGLIGARVDGRLLIRGATIFSKRGDRHDVTMMSSSKAIVANGAAIRGGVVIAPEETTKYRTRIKGDVRFRNATIAGPFTMTGVLLTATPTGRGVAFEGTNASFGGDVILINSGPIRCRILGEFRLWGATIAGVLKLEGVRLSCLKSGTALDCYTSEVKKGIFILGAWPDPTAPGESRRMMSTQILGIIGLSGARASELTVGMQPPYSYDEARAGVVLVGNLLMRRAQISGAVNLAELEISPVCSLASGDRKQWIENRLDRRSVINHACVLSASHASFEAELYVRLTLSSSGLIDLYGAHAGTLGRGADAPEESWGSFPSGHAVLGGTRGITINLDGLTYERVQDQSDLRSGRKARRNPESLKMRMLKRMIGVPSHRHLQPRIEWLDRTPASAGGRVEFAPQPYRQLAKVYREQGQVLYANDMVKLRRWRQIFRSTRGIGDRLIESLFGLLFGFGYSPGRAAASLALLFAFSYSVAQIGMHTRTASSQSCRGVICAPTQSGPEAGGCDLHQPSLEALRLILPFTRADSVSSCTVYRDAPLFWKAIKLGLQLVSWILFPLAALTFSGLLREAHGP